MKSKEQRLNNILSNYGSMVTGLSNLATDFSSRVILFIVGQIQLSSG